MRYPFIAMVSCNVDSNSRICANQVCITLQILNAKLPTIKQAARGTQSNSDRGVRTFRRGSRANRTSRTNRKDHADPASRRVQSRPSPFSINFQQISPTPFKRISNRIQQNFKQKFQQNFPDTLADFNSFHEMSKCS